MFYVTAGYFFTLQWNNTVTQIWNKHILIFKILMDLIVFKQNLIKKNRNTFWNKEINKYNYFWLKYDMEIFVVVVVRFPVCQEMEA